MWRTATCAKNTSDTRTSLLAVSTQSRTATISRWRTRKGPKKKSKARLKGVGWVEWNSLCGDFDPAQIVDLPCRFGSQYVVRFEEEPACLRAAEDGFSVADRAQDQRQDRSYAEEVQAEAAGGPGGRTRRLATTTPN